MVVVLIIGILIAIALPTFLGARTRAQNRAAQSDLRNALVAAKTIYTDASSYANAGIVANMTAVEPSLGYVILAASGSNVMILSPAATQWAAARLSASGLCLLHLGRHWRRNEIRAGHRDRYELHRGYDERSQPGLDLGQPRYHVSSQRGGLRAAPSAFGWGGRDHDAAQREGTVVIYVAWSQTVTEGLGFTVRLTA